MGWAAFAIASDNFTTDGFGCGMTQREHDEDLLAATEAAITQCRGEILRVEMKPPWLRSAEEERGALDLYAVKCELEEIRKDLLKQLDRPAT